MVDGLTGPILLLALWPVAASLASWSKHGRATTHCKLGLGCPVMGTQCKIFPAPTMTHALVLTYYNTLVMIVVVYLIWIIPDSLWCQQKKIVPLSCCPTTDHITKIFHSYDKAKKLKFQEKRYYICSIYTGPTNGGFGAWQDNSGGCSVTCGGGTRTEERLCDTPAPANGGLNCTGDFVRQLECNNQSCPRKYKNHW